MTQKSALLRVFLRIFDLHLFKNAQKIQNILVFPDYSKDFPDPQPPDIQNRQTENHLTMPILLV